MRGKHQLLPVLVGVCLMLALPAVCLAATFTVDSLGDSGTGTGLTGDLRYAITHASSGDTITFSATLVGDTITLGSTLPAIGIHLTIMGPTLSSSGITIDGNSSVQIMQVNSGATLTLQYLTLENAILASAAGSGSDALGGAINNQGTLTIANCTLSNNQAIGGSSLSIPGAGGGGAIYNSGTLTIADSTFSSNKATGGAFSGVGTPGYGLGGAIDADNGSVSVTVTNTTFSGNQAIGGAGTSQGGGAGGAIRIGDGTLTITNVTFSGNQTMGVGRGRAGGGAIFNNGVTVNLKGTILAANSPNNCVNLFTPASYSIADDGTCFTNGVNGNVVVTNTSDIGLASGLADNGGPTQTIALVPGGTANTLLSAPCTDQSSNPLNIDERGASRPAPSHPNFCSAGAYEYNPQFFYGEVKSGSLYYLTFANSTFFGYYSYQFYPWLYHYDLGFEYVVDANDGASGVFFYDTSLGSYLYTNPDDFPVLWDYALGHWLYYVAGTSRQFYDFSTQMFFTSPPS